MLSDFAQETLDLAQSLTAHKVEIGLHDGDWCELFIGDYSTVEIFNASARCTTLEAGAHTWRFGNIEAAIQAADKYETLMFAIGCLANASRQPQEVA